jgi:dTDP-4-dehydrorhamnose reductase
MFLPETPEHLSWYGWTKLLGENEILKSEAKAALVRIAYPYRANYKGKGDFARWILELYDQKKLSSVSIFTDQNITPTFIDGVSFVLSILAKEKRSGIYHVASSDLTSPYAFACYLLEKARGVENPGKIVPKGSIVRFQRNNPDRAKRPQFGGLQTARTEQALKVQFPTWREEIDKFVRQFKLLEGQGGVF